MTPYQALIFLLVTFAALTWILAADAYKRRVNGEPAERIIPLNIGEWLTDFWINARDCHKRGLSVWSSFLGGIHFANHRRTERHEDTRSPAHVVANELHHKNRCCNLSYLRRFDSWCAKNPKEAANRFRNIKQHDDIH